jgi:hypothetical protein
MKQVKKEKEKPKPQPDPIVCQVISVESYIRRSMLKLGWQLVEQTAKA